MGNFIWKSFLIVLFVAACQPTFSVQVTSTITSTMPSVPDETPIATQTPVTSFVLPTPNEETMMVIELPEWVKRSWTGGLLALPYKDTASIRPSESILVNPDNGDTFIVDLQREFYYYYWRDNEHLVFFHEGDCEVVPGLISELSVFSGILQTYETKDHPEYILDCYYIPDGDIVSLNYEFSELAVELVDPLTREISLLTDPDDGVTDISIELSPYNDFVAVVQFKGEFERPESKAPIYGNQVSVYDLQTKRLLLHYYEKVGILSDVSFIDYSNLVYMRENVPCLIMIRSLSKKCVHKITDQFPDSTIILTKNSEAARGFGFLYFSQYQGGYCFYDIYTGGLGCPTDRFPSFKNQFIINYSISSFRHYLLVEYGSEGCPAPWCDYPENTSIGLINFYEGELFELGSSDNYFLSSSFQPLNPDPWRPWR